MYTATIGTSIVEGMLRNNIKWSYYYIAIHNFMTFICINATVRIGHFLLQKALTTN